MQGIDRLASRLVSDAMTCARLTHLHQEVRIASVALTQTVLTLRQRGELVLPWQLFKEAAMLDELMTSEALLEEEVAYLHSGVGFIVLSCCAC